MGSERVTQAAITLLRLGGYQATRDDVVWLSGSGVRPSDPELLKAHAEAALRGFFHAVADGHLFVEHDEIERRYGKPVHDNYPEGGVAFLDFSRTYWTLKILVDDSMSDQSPAAGLLSQIERIIGPMFFPTPGPAHIPPDRRETDQRTMLEWSGARIDLDEFFRGNAILIRDRSVGRSGCLGPAKILIASAVAVGTLLYIVAIAVAA